ncbi:uncharacterized protein A1O5_04134 [Cladophialophora psammophila CBS 110553]|uniref:Clr5 domain-containing protein n=1 Tax=Cladophialophora psammophila CBS 110553 TaxID=1182543 RepID=W9X6N1_9EURO|nr:uncharacterized protein A1O5_04134 [Cladophialophora psammophila CBS 110553]EXJ72985.1 hypothetical protein A1O5_04134 [Cladophialophora psammophila CBS 110553]
MAETSQFRFKQQHPNNPSKNPSLAKGQWEELKSMISDLLHRGVSISEILRQLDSNHVHVTRSQLTTQMNKWGFINDKKKLHQGDRPISNQDSTQVHVTDSDTEAPTVYIEAFINSTLPQLKSLELETHAFDQPESAKRPQEPDTNPENSMNQTNSDIATHEPDIPGLVRWLMADQQSQSPSEHSTITSRISVEKPRHLTLHLE